MEPCSTLMTQHLPEMRLFKHAGTCFKGGERVEVDSFDEKLRRLRCESRVVIADGKDVSSREATSEKERRKMFAGRITLSRGILTCLLYIGTARARHINSRREEERLDIWMTFPPGYIVGIKLEINAPLNIHGARESSPLCVGLCGNLAVSAIETGRSCPL